MKVALLEELPGCHSKGILSQVLVLFIRLLEDFVAKTSFDNESFNAADIYGPGSDLYDSRR